MPITTTYNVTEYSDDSNNASLDISCQGDYVLISESADGNNWFDNLGLTITKEMAKDLGNALLKCSEE